MIHSALPSDAETITHIYNHYILNTVVTFEEQPVASQEITRRMAEVSSAQFPWLVVELSGRIVGYAYASPWKGRSAYRCSVESTVYLDPVFLGAGFGSQLYEALLADLRRKKVHGVIGGIALPNEASIRLHEKFGFRKVAEFKETDYKLGQWVDVGYWRLILKEIEASSAQYMIKTYR